MPSVAPIGISLPKQIISRIDLERGDVPRSKYLLRILERMYSSEKAYEGMNNKCSTQDSCDYRVESLSHESNSPHQDLFIPIGQKLLQSETSSICNAVGCNAGATTEIQVNAGQKGSITLSLCGNCVDKFRDQAQLDKAG
jgi:hypothetical protein